MKTIIISLLLAFATFAPCATINAKDLDKGEYIPTRDIVVRDISMPKGPSADPRSAIPTIWASYSGDMSLLELTFNKNIGVVTVYVINEMGQCVANCNCNTSYETDLLMNVALDEGAYTIRIIGTDYDGEGAFMI